MNQSNPLGDLGKLLLVVGVLMIGAGVLIIFGPRLPFRLGRLPGDIAYQHRRGSFYFPIVTCILLSVVLTLLFWIVDFFRH